VSDSLLKIAIRRHGAEAVYAALSPEERERLPYEWRAWARPEQIEPDGDWRIWLILAGRGFGKSRSGAEWVREQVEQGKAQRIALVARTAGDVRDVLVEGESGIMAISPPWFRPVYEPSKRRLTWPNGAIATTYSADEPNSLRGPQHDAAWADEIAAWNDPDAWDQLMFGLRLGDNPRCVATTTPRPTAIVRDLLADSRTAVTRGSTFDNAANLAPSALEAYRAKYDGTRLGRQELYAELLLDTPGALWTASVIDAGRVRTAPPFVRCIVGVDPSGSSHRKGEEIYGTGQTARTSSDEAGIVTVGVGKCACKGNAQDLHGFVVEDKSGILSPEQWGKAAAQAFHRHRADRIVAEKNFGGDMVQTILRMVDPSVSYREVVATRGKALRAAPIAALYEQGRVHHVGYLPHLEDELTTWDPLHSRESPGRLDALVWALTEAMAGAGVGQPANIVSESHGRWSRAGGL